MPSSNHRNEQDLYRVLGVSREATLDDIKRAYKRLALRWHPDKNPNDKEEAERKFKDINAAYDILSNENKREIYNRYGMDGLRAKAAGQNHNHDFGGLFTRRRNGAFPRAHMFEPSNPIFDFVFRDPFEIFREFFGSSSPFDLDSLFDTGGLFDDTLGGGRRRQRNAYQRATSSPDSEDLVDHFADAHSLTRILRNNDVARRGHPAMSLSSLSSPFMGGGGLLGNLLGFSGPSFDNMFSFGFSNISGNFHPTVKSTIQTEIRNGKVVTVTRKEQNGQVIETVEENGILKSKTIDGNPVNVNAAAAAAPLGRANGTTYRMPTAVNVTIDSRAKRRRK